MLNSPLTTPQFSRILWCAALLMLCCFSGCSNARMADDKGITKTENYNGRDYIFYTPIALAHSSSPLLIILHGGGGSAEWMQRHLSMEAMANRYGFKLAYLNGNPGERFFSHNMRTWNAGDCCGIAAAKQLDDVGYLTGFINHLVQQGEADASRISLLGHSNGAMMSYRYACSHSDKIAAVVAVSGTLSLALDGRQCQAQHLAILHVHGMEDENVPINGGTGKKSITKDIQFRAVADNTAIFRQAGADISVTLLPNTPHKLTTISENMAKNNGASLEETAARFINGKTSAANR
jgi:polyhydroxybutyrate depolymerase